MKITRICEDNFRKQKILIAICFGLARKGVFMKKFYVEPEAEIIEFDASVMTGLTASTDAVNDAGYDLIDNILEQ